MSYSTLVPSEIKPMSFNDKMSHLVIFMEKWPHVRDWKDTILYVLKHEDENMQFILMDSLLERMPNLNISVFHSTFEYIGSEIELAKSLRTFLLLLGTILCYGSNTYLYQLERSVEAFIKKSGLLREEILSSDGVPINKLPQELNDAVAKGITSLPQLINKCPHIIQPDWLMSLLHWVAVYSIRSLDELYHLDEFCRVVMNALYNPTKPSTDADKERVTLNVLVTIWELCRKKYEGAENYFLVLEHIPDNLLQKTILNNRKEFHDYKTEDYVKLFTVLSQVSLSPKIVRLALLLSEMLRELKDFFLMRSFYYDFILPRIIAGPLKLSTVAKDELRELVSMYVEGFNEHISISSDQLREMVAQLADQDPALSEYWLRIAFVIAHPQPQLVKTLNECISLRSKSRMNDYLNEEEYQRIKAQGWKISDKALEQKKHIINKKCSITGIKQSEGTLLLM